MKYKFLFPFALFPTILMGSVLSIFRNVEMTNAENNLVTFDYSEGENTVKLSGSKALESILDSQLDLSNISDNSRTNIKKKSKNAQKTCEMRTGYSQKMCAAVTFIKRLGSSIS